MTRCTVWYSAVLRRIAARVMRRLLDHQRRSPKNIERNCGNETSLVGLSRLTTIANPSHATLGVCVGGDSRGVGESGNTDEKATVTRRMRTPTAFIRCSGREIQGTKRGGTSTRLPPKCTATGAL